MNEPLNVQCYQAHWSRSLISADRYLIVQQGDMEFSSTIGIQKEQTTDHGTMLALADGMGGLSNDRLASELAIRCFRRLYQNDLALTPAALARFLRESHHILRQQIYQSNLPMMGCSLLIVWLKKQQVSWASIGNTSLYLYRKKNVKRLNCSHNFSELTQRSGSTTIQRGDRLAQAWLYGCRLQDQASLIHLDPDRDTGTFKLQPHDRILLTTNGLSDKITTEELQACMQLEAPRIVEKLWTYSPRFEDDATAILLTSEPSSVAQSCAVET